MPRFLHRPLRIMFWILCLTTLLFLMDRINNKLTLPAFVHRENNMQLLIALSEQKLAKFHDIVEDIKRKAVNIAEFLKVKLDGIENEFHYNEEDNLFESILHRYKIASSQLRELWLFLQRNFISYNKAGSNEKVYNELYDRYLQLFVWMEKLRDILEPIRVQHARNISALIFQRLHYLQNPKDCSAAKFAICDLDKDCGFGCQMHHVAYCFITAYAMQRTLYLNGTSWIYTTRSFHDIFHPITSCNNEMSFSSVVEWDGQAGDLKQHRLLKIPNVESLLRLPDFMPLAIPKDLSIIASFHGQPFTFWVGHFLRYILRPLPSTCEKLFKQVKSRLAINIENIKPFVGIHVRRSDKLLGEGNFYPIGKYMKFVAEYYDQLEIKLGKKLERRVYLATDQPSVIASCQRFYSTFTFYSDPSIAESALPAKRYSEDSLMGILIDVFFLARSDFLVCTFSSQICRLAYELMQILHGDASDRFRSLDDEYYYGGQQERLFQVFISHNAASADEIELLPGDLVHITISNTENGISIGTNHRTGQNGSFPTYKIRDFIATAVMPTYSEIPYDSHFRLPNDSCLFV